LYRLTQHLTTASDFADNYEALNQSCSDLVGTAGITTEDCVEVRKALDAVEMAKALPCPQAPPPVPALCPAGQTATSLFSDGFEDPASGEWSTKTLSGVNHWSWDGTDTGTIYFPTFPRSGLYSLWGFDYGLPADSTVEMTRDVVLPLGARMQFSHAFEFQLDTDGTTPVDGGVLEYSADGGQTWTDAGNLVAAGAPYGPTWRP
jgi:hypothetical protein